MGVLWRRAVLAYGLGALMTVEGLAGPLESLTRERWVPLDSTATDQTTDVATSSSGSMVYISGYKQGAPGADGTQNIEALLMAYNSSGAQQWAVEYGSGVETLGNSVAADGTGVYLAGTDSVPSNDTGADEQADTDAFVVKYNSTGGLVWKTSWGTSEPDQGNGVAVDDGSNLVYVVGTTKGSMDEEARASGTPEEAAEAAAGEGGALAGVGTSEGEGGSDAGGGGSESAGLEGKVVAANAGASDVFLTCLDAVEGGVLWTRQFGSSSADAGISVAVGPRGGVFLVGQLGDDEDLSLTGPRAFLAKYDYLGNAQFTARLNSSSTHYAVDLAPSVGSGGEGVVYMSGYTLGDNPEVFLARFEGSTGAQTWLSHLGEESGMPHQAQSVAVVEGNQRGFIGGGTGGGGSGGGRGGDSSAAASSATGGGGGAPVVEGGGAAAYSEPGNGARVVVVGHNTSVASAESHSSTGFTAAADTNGEWTWYSVSQKAERETAIAIGAGGGVGGVGDPEDSFAFIVGTVAADEASPGNYLFLDVQKVVRQALPTPAPAVSSGLTPGPSVAIGQMGGASATTGLSQGSSLWLLIIAPIFVVVSCILIVGYVSKQCTIAFGTRPRDPEDSMGSMEFTPRGVGGSRDHGGGNKRPSSRSKRSLRRAKPSPPVTANWRDEGSPRSGSPAAGRRRRQGKEERGWPRSVAAALRSKGDGGPGGPPYRKLETNSSDRGGGGPGGGGGGEPLPSRGRESGGALGGEDPELAMTAHRGGARVVSASVKGPSEEGSWVGGDGGSGGGSGSGRGSDRKSLGLDSPEAPFEWDAFESEAPAGAGGGLGADVSGNPREDEPAGMFGSDAFVDSPESPRLLV
ncbi:unnamed protein product [Laminaria digitata]